MTDWLETPAGAYLLAWEQTHLDAAVADLFGFHAVQLGLPELDALRANRMPHRWVATETAEVSSPAATAGTAAARTAAAPPATATATMPAPVAAGVAPPVPRAAVALRCQFDALPFDSSSLDLVVLPHALEFAQDPHRALREVDRVLVPEGRMVIVGFNPASLWGLRQWLGVRRRALAAAHRGPFLPSTGEFLRYRRLRDWLRLLGFEVEDGRFGCYRPPLTSGSWLQRFAWMEQAGERWWPVFGAVYFVVAVKRVRGMRLVGLARAQRAPVPAAPAPVVATHHHVDEDTR